MNQPPDQGCTHPPEGWYCSREPGHEGPCAAYPVNEQIPASEIVGNHDLAGVTKIVASAIAFPDAVLPGTTALTPEMQELVRATKALIRAWRYWGHMIKDEHMYQVVDSEITDLHRILGKIK